MDGRLAYTVAVTDDDGSTHWYGPDDTVPAWAAKQISNPDAWDVPAADTEDGQDGQGDQVAYASMSKKDLEAEVATRNAEREPDDDDYIVVDAPGNKPDLIRALESDDAVED